MTAAAHNKHKTFFFFICFPFLNYPHRLRWRKCLATVSKVADRLSYCRSVYLLPIMIVSLYLIDSVALVPGYVNRTKLIYTILLKYYLNHTLLIN